MLEDHQRDRVRSPWGFSGRETWELGRWGCPAKGQSQRPRARDADHGIPREGTHKTKRHRVSVYTTMIDRVFPYVGCVSPNARGLVRDRGEGIFRRMHDGDIQHSPQRNRLERHKSPPNRLRLGGLKMLLHW